MNPPPNPAANSAPSLVPLPITLGLGGFVLLFSLGSFIPLPAAERPFSLIAVVVLVHLIAVPLLFLAGAAVMNKVNGDRIHWRNALSLGWLIAGVWILWKMGAGS